MGNGRGLISGIGPSVCYKAKLQLYYHEDEELWSMSHLFLMKESDIGLDRLGSSNGWIVNFN